MENQLRHGAKSPAGRLSLTSVFKLCISYCCKGRSLRAGHPYLSVYSRAVLSATLLLLDLPTGEVLHIQAKSLSYSPTSCIQYQTTVSPMRSTPAMELSRLKETLERPSKSQTRLKKAFIIYGKLKDEYSLVTRVRPFVRSYRTHRCTLSRQKERK